MGSVIINTSILLIGVIALSLSIQQLNTKLDVTNRSLQKIVKHLGLYDISLDEELKDLLLEGKKIEAIKHYRQKTGQGLKEAADYVEELGKAK